MAVDVTVYLADQPGELARLGDVLGAAKVNIDGMCAMASGGGDGEVHGLAQRRLYSDEQPVPGSLCPC
jgi:hypothetical protein